MNLYQIVAIVSAIICLLGILLGFVGFPLLLVKMIKKSISLKPGSDVRAMWEQVPFPVNFSVYVFNLTNPEETQNGGKPKVAEVGPFVFEEWKDKFNVVDIEEEDAVTFNMRNTFIFRPDLGLSGEEIITMPHPLIQVMAISMKRGNPEMINVVAAAFEGIFKPTTPFVTAPFMDIFYRGIDVDCSANNEAVQGICTNFHSGGVKGAVKETETLFKFSLMGAGNHSDAGHFKVGRGIKVSHDVGKVLQYNGEDELKIWKGEQCNRFHGTDSTIFPPLMKPTEGLWSFSADLCRSMGAHFQQPTNYFGVPVLRYVMDFGDPKNEPENQCFCKDYPNDCPAKGTMELSLCNHSPMIVSLPHFLEADTKLLEAIDGLSPEFEKHGIFIDFEIISATPLAAVKRMQFSLDVEPISEIEVMKNLRPLVMPLFWIEESAYLDKTIADMLKAKIFGIFKINNAFKWAATILGALGLLLSLYLMRSSKRDKQITAINIQPEPK